MYAHVPVHLFLLYLLVSSYWCNSQWLPAEASVPKSYPWPLHFPTLVTNLRAKAAAAELDVEFEEAARTAVKSEKEDEEQRVRGKRDTCLSCCVCSCCASPSTQPIFCRCSEAEGRPDDGGPPYPSPLSLLLLRGRKQAR